MMGPQARMLAVQMVSGLIWHIFFEIVDSLDVKCEKKKVLKMIHSFQSGHQDGVDTNQDGEEQQEQLWKGN